MSAENQETKECSAKNETLPQKSATDESIKDSTLRFALPSNESNSNHKTDFETEPIKILQKDLDLFAERGLRQNSIENIPTEVLPCELQTNKFPFDELKLKRKKYGWRFVLIQIYFVFILTFLIANFYQVSQHNSDTFQIYMVYLIKPFLFIFVGFTVFLLKPNNKLALLMALMFGLFVLLLDDTTESVSSVLVNGFLLVAGLISLLVLPTLLHFFLIFPEPLSFVKRHPRIEGLIYLPSIIFLVPIYLFLTLPMKVGWIERTDIPEIIFYLAIIIGSICILFFYGFGSLLMLLLNYLWGNQTIRRKLKFTIVALFMGFIPYFLLDPLIGLLVEEFNIQIPFGNKLWLITELPLFIIPFVFAYAIVRHKVIPISLIIRRGLQYLLAKNALRLLLILPVFGITWNIISNPNRTLSEILFNNSLSFYFFIAVVAVNGLLIRSRLNEWVDRRFFREQYNQEKILRELTEAVKESDSLLKLSRLVSSKIQLALHPENVYLFFRDDINQSDFSLGYTTASTGENSSNLKLAADSPLLRFMQQQQGTVEFPTSQTDKLPDREKSWLRDVNANLIVPMHSTDGKLAGIFLLGEKLSQIPYLKRDKELLETLANQIALVHENLSLKDRMRREQKIKHEILARFEEGSINLLKECLTCGRCFDRNYEKCSDDNSELTFSLPVERTIENRYRLERLIGKGGMGAVYEATDLRINRSVAVKILSGAMFGNKGALRRFEREAQTAGKLHHRNIITVFDYGVLSTEGAFLVMELVKGNTLSKVLNHERKLDVETVIAWFIQVIDGLEAAHKAGIIHRDLKPDNILITRSKDNSVRLCILDFGLARFIERELAGSITIPGTIMGTLGYMSPEQMRGENTDERGDLFAIGVMIYETLNGEKPYVGETYQEIMNSMNNEMAVGKNDPFAKFFKGSLALNPEKRFTSASEMKTTLLEVVEDWRNRERDLNEMGIKE